MTEEYYECLDCRKSGASVNAEQSACDDLEKEN